MTTCHQLIVSDAILHISSLNACKKRYNSTFIHNYDRFLLCLFLVAQLFNAITNGNLAMVKQMLDFGLNVNYIYDKEQKYSFLHLACLMGYSKIIK